MRAPPWIVRLGALLGPGALALHQLRYLVGYRSGDAGTRAAHIHAYLLLLGPALAGLLLLALTALVGRAARRSHMPTPRLAALWAGTSAALLAVYCAQELAEGSGLLAHRGWIALPLAALIGLALAATMRVASGAAAGAGSGRRPWGAPLAPGPALLLAAAPASLGRGGVPLLRVARGPPLACA